MVIRKKTSVMNGENKKPEICEVQAKLTEMLKWFHCFCQEHHIRYYVIGGTLLGAARHKGFIPWDDDIDLGIPRDDYNRLMQVFSDDSGKYVLETVNSPELAYCYPLAKIYDTETVLIENTYRPLVRGLYLDIFPIDGVGNTEEEARAYIDTIRKKYQLYLSRVCGIRQGRKWYKNLAVYSMRLIPQFVIDDIKLRKKIDELCQRNNYAESAYIANCVGDAGYREIVPKEFFGDPVEYEFEGLRVMGPSQYDAYLTHIYGDWRKLPPVEKRKTHHDFLICNLDMSYLEYGKEKNK